MIYELTDKIHLYHGDCMDFMAGCKEKEFDLSIVDPPYGIKESSRNVVSRHHSQSKYKRSNWDDSAPDKNYFNMLISTAHNQIIWGANHFISKIPYDSSCWIFWDKDRYGDFADGELAWTSFKSAVRYFKYTWDGFRKEKPEERFHPTQKPVALYKWLLTNYAKPGQRIFDSHGGSMSIGIAAYDLGFDITICEKDDDYFFGGKARIEEHVAKYAPATDIATTKQGQVKLF